MIDYTKKAQDDAIFKLLQNNPDGFLTNDDEFKVLPLGDLFVDGISFFGQNYTREQIFASSNGYITFGTGNSSYTPRGILGYDSAPIIAAHFDDYDPRKGGSITTSIEGNSVLLSFNQVQPYTTPTSTGDYSQGNTFTIRLTDNDSNPGDGTPGEWSYEIDYGLMTWTGGNPDGAFGTAGYNAQVEGFAFEFPSSGQENFINDVTFTEFGLDVSEGQARPTDRAGNSINEARQLGLLIRTPRSVADVLGPRFALDTKDYYQFELNKDSFVSLNVNSNGNDPTLTWYAEDGSTFVPETIFAETEGEVNRYDLQAGTYYIKLEEKVEEIAYTLTLSADPQSEGIEPPEINNVSIAYIGNQGTPELAISGNNLTPNSTVIIRNSEGIAISGELNWINNNEVIILLDDLPETGAYSVNITNESGEVNLEDAFFQPSEIEEGGLEINVSTPGFIRPNWIADAVITYTNIGDAPLRSPIIAVNIEGGEFLEETDGAVTSITIPGSEETNGQQLQFLALTTEGEPSVLNPGETGQFVAEFKLSEGSSSASFSANTLDPDFAINWAELEDNYRDSYETGYGKADDEAWAIIWDNFQNRMGDTTGDYVNQIAGSGARLAQINQPIPSINELIDLELSRASQFGSIAKRFKPSELGLGRTFEYFIEYSIVDDNVAQVTIGNDNVDYVRQEDGSYLAENGALLSSEDGAGERTLTLPSNRNIVFNADNKARSITDDYGRVVSISYDESGNIQTIIESNQTYNTSRQSTINWNANNLIASIQTQDRGGAPETTSYTYDSQNRVVEEISSKLGINNSIQYSYINEGAAKHSFNEIRFADGTSTRSEYDNQGELSAVLNFDNEGNPLASLNYETDQFGKLVITNLNDGSIFSSQQNDKGLNARQVTATNTILDYRYSPSGQIEQIIKDGELEYRYDYDDMGNIASKINAVGDRETYEYNERGQNVQFIDNNGSRTRFIYDSAGRVTSALYADNSFTSIEYNENGQIARTLNRRGQEVLLSYDEFGPS
jgi:YD repeat-containing protein